MSLPNEHWQGQQKLARAKLARLEAPDKEVEASAQAVHNLAAKLNVTPAASGTADPLNAQEEHHDGDKIPRGMQVQSERRIRERQTNS